MGFDPKKASTTKKRPKRWSAARASASSAPQLRETLSAADAVKSDLEQQANEFLAMAERCTKGADPAEALTAMSNLERMLADVQRMRQEMGSMRPQRTTAADMAKYHASLARLTRNEATLNSILDTLRTFVSAMFGPKEDANRAVDELERIFVERGAPFPIPRSGVAGSSDGRFVELE
ncbi:hypothetical protein H9P43_006797 [Blastocladiella emersonii ATCC 22665]|nr:hypothetical protein H9P43_006797 [Blastocladiella emersonii ATCC 22665]